MMKVAIIGGTGHEQFDDFSHLEGATIDTPYGKPNAEIFTGKIDGKEIFYLSRFGRNNAVAASKVNYRANLYALKKLGCSVILSTSECASLREEIRPGEFVIPDQFIDFTKQVHDGFHDDHIVQPARDEMADPFSAELRDHLTEAAIIKGITVHNRGTVITIEGRRYASRAESNLYRKWGSDIIDMTTALEVIAANQLQIPYAQVSLCTEFDTWRVVHEEDSIANNPEVILAGHAKIMQILFYTIGRIQEADFSLRSGQAQ